MLSLAWVDYKFLTVIFRGIHTVNLTGETLVLNKGFTSRKQEFCQHKARKVGKIHRFFAQHEARMLTAWSRENSCLAPEFHHSHLQCRGCCFGVPSCTQRICQEKWFKKLLLRAHSLLVDKWQFSIQREKTYLTLQHFKKWPSLTNLFCRKSCFKS